MLTQAELRGEVAKRQITLYKLAADVGIHPGRLGRILNERLPLPPRVAEKIMQVLDGGEMASVK